MTLVASAQCSQLIRSKFRSVLQLRIHRRSQDQRESGQKPDQTSTGSQASTHSTLLPTNGSRGPQRLPQAPGPWGTQPSFTQSFPPRDSVDPWISASPPDQASITSSSPLYCDSGETKPSPTSLPFSGVSLKKAKGDSHQREPRPRLKPLKYHAYVPPEHRGGPGTGAPAQGSPPREDGQLPGHKQDLSLPRDWGSRTGLQDSSEFPEVPRPLVPKPKLELQTLRLEELTAFLSQSSSIGVMGILSSSLPLEVPPQFPRDLGKLSPASPSRSQAPPPPRGSGNPFSQPPNPPASECTRPPARRSRSSASSSACGASRCPGPNPPCWSGCGGPGPGTGSCRCRGRCGAPGSAPVPAPAPARSPGPVRDLARSPRPLLEQRASPPGPAQLPPRPRLLLPPRPESCPWKRNSKRPSAGRSSSPITRSRTF